MAYTATKLYRGQPDVAIESLYDVATGTTIIVKEIVLVNTAAATANISLYFVPVAGTAADSNLIVSDNPINANDTIIVELSTILPVGEAIKAIQTTTGAITTHISGVVIT